MAFIKKDGASWYFVVSHGKDPITLKPRQIKKRGFKTKNDAELAAMELELEIKKGEFFKGENMKLQSLYEEWIKAYSYTRKESSIRVREKSAKHLLKVWSDIPINKITKQVYRKYMNSLIPRYKYNTRDGIHIVAKMIYDYAVDMDYLSRNPTDNYQLARDKVEMNEKTKVVFLEKDELYNLLSIAKKEGLENDYEFFSLLAFTGMRIGELICLKWEDIDFKNHTIDIYKTYYSPNNNKTKFKLTPTKSKSSNRKISISSHFIDLLLTVKEKQRIIKQSNKGVYLDQKFIFTCNQGYPRSYRFYANRLNRLLKKASVVNKHITPHSFRHTHASLLIENDASLIFISNRLGHSSMETTDKIYSHLTEGLKEKTTPQLDE